MAIFAKALRPKGKQVLFGAALTVSFAGATVAGDLTTPVSDPVVVGPERYSDDVSAFYLGLNAGYGFGGTDRFGLRTGGGTFDIGNLKPSGAYGGIRGGWRGVVPATGGRDYVYGFELGYDFGSLEDTVSRQIGTTTVTGGSEISDVLSLKFRNGLTNKSGSVLYFVSFGLVQGEVATTNSTTSGGTTRAFEEKGRRNGLSASIGAEHQLNDNWSITGEYEYVQFESKDVVFGSGFSTKSTPKYSGLRVGLNYKF
ncbi:outer membrane beta-barrel protein [Roseibium sp. RKSG952]|uniref:outer membrane protein n=1 Tax=Roseibium sp. RKSG952 TaxID=2529384 RepID=UPI001AD940AD